LTQVSEGSAGYITLYTYDALSNLTCVEQHDLLERAGIGDFRFHDLRHTFASHYMMNGGDLYELAKILGHSNIKMTERYAKLGRQHIARTGNTAREMWKLLALEEGDKAYAV